jgi:lysophospholipase L1-like esterase
LILPITKDSDNMSISVHHVIMELLPPTLAAAVDRMGDTSADLYQRLGQADDLVNHPLWVPLMDFLSDPLGGEPKHLPESGKPK